MNAAKPFTIPKQQVMEAFKAVKANAGGAGVDKQSIEDFEKDLKDKNACRPLYRRNRKAKAASILSLAARDCRTVCLMGAV
jgi:hypothetical protein